MAFLRATIAMLLLATSAIAVASTTSFHYAGTLTDATLPTPSGSYDFRVRLFDGGGAGASQVGSDVLLSSVPVIAGYFSVDLDFGSAVLTPSAWLEFAVKASADATYETLSPRQQIGHVPLALYAEGTDWSGVANVPQALRELTGTSPPAIGKLVIAPLPPTAPADGLVVHRIAFTTTRPVTYNSGIVVGASVFHELEVWVEPSLATPELMKDMAKATTLTKVDLFLDFVGAVPSTDYFAEFTGGRVTSLALEPANDGNPELVHLTFGYGNVEFRIQGGTDYGFNLTTQTGTAVPGICPAFLSTLSYPFAVGAGILTQAMPSVLDATNPAAAGINSGPTTPTFQAPEWSAAMDPAKVTASRKLAICALAMATASQTLTEPVTWSEYPTASSKSDGWTLQIGWGTVYVTGLTLSSDLAGTLRASVSFTPTRFRASSKAADDSPANAYSSCWDVAAIAETCP